MPLGGQREIDHHNGVLLHNADQQDDPDHGDDAQIGMRQHERQQRAHARRGQRGKNRDRMDVAFVENSEHDINRRQRGRDQDGLVAERILVCLRRAGEARLDAARQAHRGGRPGDGFHRVSQGHARLQVERDGGRRAKALMRDRQRRGGRGVAGDGV